MVSALEVVGEEEVMVVSAGGNVFRVSAGDVPQQHRRSRGRRIVRLPAGDRVAEVTRAPGSGRGVGAIGEADGTTRADDVGGREQMELLR